MFKVVDAAMAMAQPSLNNADGLYMPVNTRWNIPLLANLLSFYSDQQVVKWLQIG